VIHATEAQTDLAIQIAADAAFAWDNTPVDQRAGMLERAADLFEKHTVELMSLAIREGGKTIPDAISEVREAVDYCRYYAVQGRKDFSCMKLPGPTGEYNRLQLQGRGIIACISPWNFPLAIFIGQVTASLVAGNSVIAKPAKQTPLIAARAVALLHEAGIPKNVLHLLPGSGAIIGARLLADPRVQGVVLTGSTETARTINQTLAARPGPIIPLIAETGGQNAMIVDSSALPEQVVADVIQSAFTSAGQRCSALRVLYIQEDVAQKMLHMLQGAMAELRLGKQNLLETDIGPVIDEDAKAILERHAALMCNEGKLLYQVPVPADLEAGSYFGPCAFEIDSIKRLTQEIFGPILHIVRYKAKDLESVLADINSTGFGLTFGIHSRIDETVQFIKQRMRAGNTYVNRNMIGAVVGVQPFGGEGLSGTGPKAGGPHYLYRLCTERTLCINTTAAGGNATLMSLKEE
jgi:RHH-type proline utilization regulon transcriptional repressor/proline dehydrogenase/delta 1-pyrroline-5-carboxylate dehydrogenase